MKGACAERLATYTTRVDSNAPGKPFDNNQHRKLLKPSFMSRGSTAGGLESNAPYYNNDDDSTNHTNNNNNNNNNYKGNKYNQKNNANNKKMYQLHQEQSQ